MSLAIQMLDPYAYLKPALLLQVSSPLAFLWRGTICSSLTLLGSWRDAEPCRVVLSEIPSRNTIPLSPPFMSLSWKSLTSERSTGRGMDR